MLEQPWKPVSRWAGAAWVSFYAVFLVYAFSKHGEFLFIDLANLVAHEGGHLLFGWFGQTLGIWGGTLLQWLVPFVLAAYFFYQRQATAFVFCTFFFFENWLYTASFQRRKKYKTRMLSPVADRKSKRPTRKVLTTATKSHPKSRVFGRTIRKAGVRLRGQQDSRDR